MKMWRTILMALGAVLVFGMANLTILQKQEIVEGGRQVLLKMVPFLPLSLTDRDHVRLHYDPEAYPDHREVRSLPWRGTVVLALDENGVGRFARLDDGTPPAADEVRIAYKMTGRFGSMHFGAGSYTFQEGDSDRYANAYFGVLRVDDDGESVLIGLAGKDGTLIEPD